MTWRGEAGEIGDKAIQIVCFSLLGKVLDSGQAVQNKMRLDLCLVEAQLGRGETLADKVKAYIAEHYSENISRQELANLLFVNSDYLSRIFNKEAEMPIPDYITQVRMEEAKRLLHTYLLNRIAYSHIILELIFLIELPYNGHFFCALIRK